MRDNLYFKIKPIIPRPVQIWMRRQRARWLLNRIGDRWPIDTNSAKPPLGWSDWPDEKRFALVLTHDVETVKGQDRCLQLMKLERELGFRASFNFVAERYTNHVGLFDALRAGGCEIGLHGLRHHDNVFKSYRTFKAQVPRINKYLKDWGAEGFRAPCMYHNLDWTHELDIEYDASTFDTDPFEPQPDGVGTIFPIWVAGKGGNGGYIELPYTLPQDFTLFVLFQEKNIEIWKRKLDWIAENRGMVLLITHPDYMTFGDGKCESEEYPVNYYMDFLHYVKSQYHGQYWNPLPKEMARFWKKEVVAQDVERAIINRQAKE
jgi:peptidoglycan/xylan/chitin deacetylase (PgdA/CDA1 family)